MRNKKTAGKQFFCGFGDSKNNFAFIGYEAVYKLVYQQNTTGV